MLIYGGRDDLLRLKKNMEIAQEVGQEIAQGIAQTMLFTQVEWPWWTCCAK
jgi:hypothetical protein